jgi:hypothetical protein
MKLNLIYELNIGSDPEGLVTISVLKVGSCHIGKTELFKVFIVYVGSVDLSGLFLSIWPIAEYILMI